MPGPLVGFPMLVQHKEREAVGRHMTSFLEALDPHPRDHHELLPLPPWLRPRLLDYSCLAHGGCRLGCEPKVSQIERIVLTLHAAALPAFWRWLIRDITRSHITRPRGSLYRSGNWIRFASVLSSNPARMIRDASAIAARIWTTSSCS